jgi:hypothetical protein
VGVPETRHMPATCCFPPTNESPARSPVALGLIYQTLKLISRPERCGRGSGTYRGAVRFEVTEVDTAVVVGSGDVPVLATPRLIAWMEAATVQRAASFVGAGQTTVATDTAGPT